jgi:hypothetical protein
VRTDGRPAPATARTPPPNVFKRTQVGEPRSGRICLAAVAAHLTRHHMAFDRRLLAAMFEEADFRREGSLAPREFVAAVSGATGRRRGLGS